MKKTLYYLKDYKKESIFGPLFKLLEASFELIVPLIVASVIDRGIPSGNSRYITVMCLALLIPALLGFVCSVTAQYFSAKAACGFGCKLRHAMFQKIQSFSFEDIDRFGAGTLVTRMTGDINQIQSTVNIVLRLFLRSPFIVFGAMIMAFTIDFRSALVFACTIPILSAIVFGIMLGTMPLYRRVQRALDNITTKTGENLEGTRVIRAFCAEDREIEEYSAANDVLNKLQILSGKISSLMNPATFIVINIAVIFLIHVGAIRVNAGALTQGKVVALYNYMSQILVELIKMAGFIINITKACACAGRIEEVLNTEPSLKSGTVTDTENSGYAVRFDSVSLKYFGGGDAAIEGVSFDAGRGDTVGIIGSTGSGKSSLVSLIPRFYDASSGSVEVFGHNVKNYDLDFLRKNIGFVMQKNILFKGTIRDNILWGNPDASENDISEAIRISQSQNIIDSKPDGLGTVIEEGGANLSGGQRQRLTIARALVRKPKILILDDSTSALDYATDAALRQEIKNLDYHPTVFIVSQRTASISGADKIIVLDDGRVVGIGTHDELLENCDVYREIHMSQR